MSRSRPWKGPPGSQRMIPGAIDRSPLGLEDRTEALVVAPYSQRARTVAWAGQVRARILQGWASGKELLVSEKSLYVGVDVSKSTLDVEARPKSQRSSFPNKEEGINRLVSKLVKLSPDLVVLEATG